MKELKFLIIDIWKSQFLILDDKWEIKETISTDVLLIIKREGGVCYN